VTITGAGFTAGATIDFGTTPASNVVVNTATQQITATSPAGTGLVNVTVTTAGGTSATSAADQFSYAPVVSGISPVQGLPAGGTSVTITGANFTAASTVKFGTTPATNVVVNTATQQITATSPAGMGVVDVTVTTAGGTSATSSADKFSYAPMVTGVSPAAGPTAGGTSVTITGAGFTGATVVDFGTAAASSFTVNSDTQITVTSPAGSGTVPVTVKTPGGTSSASSADQFTYLAVATVIGVSSTEATGAYKAGTVIPITVSFPEQVRVTGSPQLALNAGSGAVAVYTGGSGGTTLTFTYTVAAGQNSSDLDYTSISAMVLNGGTIDDTAGIAANLTLPAPGTDGLATRNILIETTPPTVSGISSSKGAGIYEAATAIPITLTFSNAVTVTAGTPQLALNAGSGAVAYYTSGSGTTTLTFTYTVAVGQSSLDLDYSSTAALTPNGATIQDAAGNAAVLTLPATGTDSLATRRIVIDSSPPTVATAATAVPNPVTGKTVNLSVLGADVDTGQASLKYTWQATSVPSGLATPTFSANGSNAAQDSTATFSQAGTYLFTVTIADLEGLTVTSSVRVTVNQTLTTITMSPSQASLYLGTTQQFSATAKDQFGIALSPQPTITWTTTTGTISSSGLLTAPNTSATGTVTSASGSVRGTATVNVVQPINTAYVVPDGFVPGTTALYIFGSSGSDDILVNPASGPGTVAGEVTVEINGKLLGTFHPTGRIIVHGETAQGGSDYIGVSSQVTNPAWLYGDAGTDVLVGGGGPNIEIGGSGTDTLYGGKGRNILIAGTGSDELIGGAGDGLLIGGTTAYNTNDLALLAIMNEWNSSAAYATRVGYVMGETGGLNGSYYLDAATVVDDGAGVTLLGGNANDVFFQALGETVLGRRANETLVSIP
jgi:hypothetical protein